MRVKWSDEEIKLLRDNLDKRPNEIYYLFPTKSKHTLRVYMSRLRNNTYKVNPRYWGDAEKALLESVYLYLPVKRLMSLFPGRAYQSIGGMYGRIWRHKPKNRGVTSNP